MADVPVDLVAQVQWLVDRAAISDLVVEFARALDDRDWDGYASLFTDDGELELSPAMRHTGRAGMAEFAAALEQFAGTHHLVGNTSISITGDTATTRTYVLAAHVLDAAEPHRHADVAGWYQRTLRRTRAGWRFEHVKLEIRYLSGEPLNLEL